MVRRRTARTPSNLVQPKMSKSEQRNRLLELDTKSLAAAILELSTRSPEASDMIGQLISKPDEQLERFLKKLDAFNNNDEFYDWRRLSALSRKLSSLLSDIKSSIADPMQGIELVAKFFELDEHIMENCDDDGMVGDVFGYEASDLFWYYAKQIEDKDFVFDLAAKLSDDDGYGVRFGLMKNTAQLPAETIRHFISRMIGMTNGRLYLPENRGSVLIVQSMARQIHDAELYEKCAWLLEKEISQANMVKIAEVYLQSGDADCALEWMERIPKQECRPVWGFEKLLQEILKQSNNSEESAKLAWRHFHQDRNLDSFETLLNIIGRENRDRIIQDEARLINQGTGYSPVDLKFLVQVGRLEDASNYVVQRANLLNGINFGTLIFVAEALESDERYVAASIIYRVLIDSILLRARSTFYQQAADHFRKLDSMAPKIKQWGRQISHDDYTAQLRISHSKKNGFWNQLQP